MFIHWPSSSAPRVCLMTQDESEADSLLTLACEQFEHSAVLHWRGSLISNISVVENLLLPSCWPTRQSVASLSEQAHTLLAQWCNPETAILLLQKRPAQLSDEQKRLIILLRAALQNPTQLLFAHDWFNARSKSKDRSQSILRDHFADCRWWWFCCESEFSGNDNWQIVHREQWQPFDSALDRTKEVVQ